MMEKQKYVVPAIEVMEVDHEGVMAASPISAGAPQYQPGDPLVGASKGNDIGVQSYSLGDFEDMINNILTFEE